MTSPRPFGDDPLHREGVPATLEVWGRWREGPYSALWYDDIGGRWMLYTSDNRLRPGGVVRLGGKPLRRVHGIVQKGKMDSYRFRWVARGRRLIWWQAAARKGAGAGR